MRLDKYLSERFGSRNKAAKAIADGWVTVNGKTVGASHEYKEGDDICIVLPQERYVSDGGYKLGKALRDFSFDVKGKIFADVGASNGGFTDCLLQNGAEKVYCIDVGESQLDESLKDKNVVVVDRFNARNLTAEQFAERLDGVVIDVSFISLTYILQGVAQCLGDGGVVIALIKPQFECESRNVGKNGIVKDAAAHRRIIKKIYDFATECGLKPKKLTDAPIKKDKNKEYLILLQKNAAHAEPIESLIKCVKL